MSKEDFHAAANAPIKLERSPMPNKQFGPCFYESKTEAPLKNSKQKLSTSHGAVTKPGTNDIGHCGTTAPLQRPEFVKGNRPNAWPPSFEKK